MLLRYHIIKYYLYTVQVRAAYVSRKLSTVPPNACDNLKG
jgi:hypothetical protein